MAEFCFFPSHRVCYRTTIDLCGTECRLYLNRRNFQGLRDSCPSETEVLSTSDTEVIFQSPRHQCRKRNGRFYQYRNRELCLYNISVPDCKSGRVLIQAVEDNPLQLEERGDNGKCMDYLQFYYDSRERNSIEQTNRFCGVELKSRTDDDPIVLPTTNFLAVFWTDTQNNYVGFGMRARCQPGMQSGSGAID